MKTVFYETVNEADKYVTVAVVRNDSSINKIQDLKGMKACFPEYDGVAWNSVIKELHDKKLLQNCPFEQGLVAFFDEICIGGQSKLRNSCKANQYTGDMGALRCLTDKTGDVAFVSKNNLHKFKEGT